MHTKFKKIRKKEDRTASQMAVIIKNATLNNTGKNMDALATWSYQLPK